MAAKRNSQCSKSELLRKIQKEPYDDVAIFLGGPGLKHQKIGSEQHVNVKFPALPPGVDINFTMEDENGDIYRGFQYRRILPGERYLLSFTLHQPGSYWIKIFLNEYEKLCIRVKGLESTEDSRKMQDTQ